MARAEKERVISHLKESFGKPGNRKISENRKKALQSNLERFFDDDSKDLLDDLTWSDTGMDDIFHQMDVCLSAAGEEYLYRNLHNISHTKEELTDIDNTVKDIASDEDFRLRLGISLNKLGFSGSLSLPECLELISSGSGKISAGFHIFVDLTFIPAVILIFIKPIPAVILLVALVIFNIATYFNIKNSAEEHLHGVSEVIALTRIEKSLPDHDSHIGEQIKSLKKLLSSLKVKTVFSAFVINSGSNASNGIFSMLFTYINLLFHFDIIACASLLKFIAREKDNILKAYEMTGYLDMCLATSSYRVYLEGISGWCVPVFADDKRIDIEKGYIPLISKPVCNDASNDSGVLITGSNASGKSTYMRMIAVNAILAQTVSTCPANFYKACLFRIYSSIAVSDSILKGESYFMAEIRSLKRIVDAAEIRDGRTVLCFIDEILRGTNTSERIAAAASVLDHLAKEGVLVYAATHDIELTKLSAKRYKNVHFSEEITEEDVTFTYELQDGPSKTRNAIALLKKNGFPEDVVRDSEKLCSALDVKSDINVY